MKQLTGTIIKGSGQATLLGFPTANIQSTDLADIEPGVYAVNAHILDRDYPAVCFIGQAYLLDGAPIRVEAHLLEMPEEDLTGKEMTLTLREKVRDTIEFTSAEQAREVITKDIEQAKSILLPSRPKRTM